MKVFVLLFLFSFTAYSFDWQGHRGARGLYPENTIGSMYMALKYPVTTLELDVVVSKDNKVVVSHEPWMNPDICKSPNRKRYKEKSINLYKLSYEEIVKYDCGSTFYPRFPKQEKVVVGKPLLSKLLKEVESKFSDKKINYNIEIKSSKWAEENGFQPDFKTFADIVIEEVKRIIPLGRIVIQSFDWRVLKYIHEKHPEISLSALKEGSVFPERDLKSLGFKPQIFSPYYKNVSEKDIEYFHSHGIKVIPWTVNTVSEIKELISKKVDGIITDYPNLINEVLEKDCPKGFKLFEDVCVKIPTHAIPSSQNPGWDCKKGYIQKRNKCIRLKIPDNAVLSEDGKNWICKKGYVRYRASCKKE